MWVRYSLNIQAKPEAVHVMVRGSVNRTTWRQLGDAPSAKAITKSDGLAYKFYWRMGVHNYIMSHTGSFAGESMPYNDISINLKASIPSYFSKKEAKPKIGVRSNIILENDKVVDREYVGNFIKIEVSTEEFHSMSKYMNKLEEAFYEL